MTSSRYDLAILGAGVTGLGAAMYAGRLSLKTIVIGNAGERSAAQDIGGTITLTDVVENYPGFIRLTGEELAQKLEEHARTYPLIEIENAWVTKVTRETDCFTLHRDGEVIQASTLLFATGTRHRELRVPGHDEFRKQRCPLLCAVRRRECRQREGRRNRSTEGSPGNAVCGPRSAAGALFPGSAQSAASAGLAANDGEQLRDAPEGTAEEHHGSHSDAHRTRRVLLRVFTPTMVNGPWVWAKLHKSGIDFELAPVPGVGGNPSKAVRRGFHGAHQPFEPERRLRKAVSRKIRLHRGRPTDIFPNIGGSSGLLAKSRLPLNSSRQTNTSPAHRLRHSWNLAVGLTHLSVVE